MVRREEPGHGDQADGRRHGEQAEERADRAQPDRPDRVHAAGRCHAGDQERHDERHDRHPDGVHPERADRLDDPNDREESGRRPGQRCRAGDQTKHESGEYAQRRRHWNDVEPNRPLMLAALSGDGNEEACGPVGSACRGGTPRDSHGRTPSAQDRREHIVAFTRCYARGANRCNLRAPFA